MAGGHVFLCSVFFPLFGFYVVSWNVKSHLFLSSHSPFISGHEVTYVTEFSTTFLLPLSSLEGLRRHLVVNTPRKHKFLSFSVSYYPNSVSCFHQLRLVLRGDVQLNPGPVSSDSSCIISNSKLNCTLLNSRSLCSKLVEFQGLVYGNNLDVVAVTETWLHEGYFDGEIYSSSLYTIFRKNRGGNIRGGGVLLAVKTDRCEGIY